LLELLTRTFINLNLLKMKRNMNDALLVELKENQMSKESMRSVKGGSIWDSNFNFMTPTGRLFHYINPDGIHHCIVQDEDGYATYFPEELGADGRKLG